jgi:hypothetical protein
MDERRDAWQRGVDENLASLNTGQRVNDRLLEDLDANYSALDRLLRGDAEKETDGVIGRLHQIETQVAQLYSVIFMDKAGSHGLQHDVKELKEGRKDKRLKWGYITQVIVALVMSGLIGHFWQDIAAFVNRKSVDPVERMIQRAKHPKPRHRHVVREEPPETDTEAQ